MTTERALHAVGIFWVFPGELFLLQAALLRDAVARINYEETGKKKALNFPDEEPPKDIMQRARMELDKARSKAAESRTKPKAPPMKVSAAMTLDPAHTAAALAAFPRPSQQEYVRLLYAVDTGVLWAVCVYTYG